MTKEELVKNSPVRLFEKSIGGGLKSGEMGILASPRGVGKTPVLVQLALDRLLQGKKVIHVSFAQPKQQNVFVWYDDIFDEFTKNKNLDDRDDIKSEIAKNRVLMNFCQDTASHDMVFKSLRAMITDGGFCADTLVVDGFDFSATDRGYIEKAKEFASDTGLSIWCNCTVNPEAGYSDKKTPVAVKAFEDLIDVVIVLEPKSDCVELSVSKDRQANPAKGTVAKFDPKSLLLS